MKLAYAISLAFKAHEGQKRDDGTDYIYHPLAVMMSLKDESIETQIAAVLHDVIEDNPNFITLFTIDQYFGFNVAKAVFDLTKPEGEKYDDYILSIKNSKSPITKKVKIADLTHNLSTIDNIPVPEKRKRLKERYERALVILCSP